MMLKANFPIISVEIECPKSPEKWEHLQMPENNELNGCYRMFNESKSWHDAAQTCRSKSAHIASLTSEGEQEMIYQVSETRFFYKLLSINSIFTLLKISSKSPGGMS